MQHGILMISLAIGCSIAAGAFAQDSIQPAEPFVAGVAPDRRPADAPVIERMRKGDAWYGRALTGVQPPYPASLRFLEDQGAWFTPFIHPGMTGPYDIRNWHAAR